MEQNWCGQKWNLYRRNTLDGKFYTLLLSFSCNISPHVRKPRNSLGSRIPRHGSRIPGTGFQSLSVELGYWIPIVSGIPEFLDSKAQDIEFHKQKFHRFRIPHSLTWGETFLGWIQVNIFFKIIYSQEYRLFIQHAIWPSLGWLSWLVPHWGGVGRDSILDLTNTQDLYITIVVKVKWLWNPLGSFFLGFCWLFWTWPCTTFNSIPIILNLLTNRNIAFIYSVTICEQKTKDCARSGSFQHKLQQHCFQLWCLPAFLTSLLYYHITKGKCCLCFDLCDWLHHLVSFRIRTKNHRVHSHSLGPGPAVGGKGGVKWKTGERIEASCSLGKGNGANPFFFSFFLAISFRFFAVSPYCGTWSQASIHS